jgi:ubiquinone/menaquinone biosynthesis C-methylase UbiE
MRLATPRADTRLSSLQLRLRNIARWLLAQRASATGPGADFHFVRDYDRLVTKLLARYPVDEAMSRAVGGDFEHIGMVQCAVLRRAGLRDGMRLLDFGCGSGRLASALGREPIRIDYYGIDIDQRLLDFARSKAPAHFRFALNRALTLPAPNASADMVCAFSVFTHLRQAETYLYLEDIRRVLNTGGKLIFSFLEFAQPLHWEIFEETVMQERHRSLTHLNEFIERSAIQLWCEKLGYQVEAFIAGDTAPWGEAGPHGQSLVILRHL